MMETRDRELRFGEEIRLGGLAIRRLTRRVLMLVDAHNDYRYVTVNVSDLPELIEHLLRCLAPPEGTGDMPEPAARAQPPVAAGTDCG